MQLRYRILNVFTVEDRLSGNPLCVFEDGAGLSTEQMQALARQLNLSETTFILPSTTATARVRIFTPGFEMPFAGHPTLGTAHVVRALREVDDRLTLEENVGIVPVSADGDRWTLQAAKAPATRKPAATKAQLAQMLGLAEAAIGEPLWVNTGAEQLVIPVATADDVRNAKPVAALLREYVKGNNEEMAYVWARDSNSILVRFFFTQHGAVIEDPATGSACANLGGYFVATGAALPIEATLYQGAAVQRPSRLGLRVDANKTISVSGNVIELGAGVFDV